MSAKSVSLKLPADYTNIIRTLSSVPGEGLNNILDEYVEPSKLAAAIGRHVQHPVTSRAEVKATSFYLNPTRINALREFTNKTYLPFEGVVRILVQDYLQRKHLIHIQHPTNQ